jgi:hypothetical protein
MRRLRIAFLMPSYPPDSPSCIPVVTRLLAESGVKVEVINVKKRVIDLSTVRVEHDLYVLKKIDGAALSIAGALHAQGAPRS